MKRRFKSRNWGIGGYHTGNGEWIYGYPPNGLTPFEFSPDFECCTEFEIARWKRALAYEVDRMVRNDEPLEEVLKVGHKIILGIELTKEEKAAIEYIPIDIDFEDLK